MDAVPSPEAAWEPSDYLTTLDRFFEMETMEEWAIETRSDSCVADWNLKQAA
jgi:hypothetical protein